MPDEIGTFCSTKNGWRYFEGFIPELQPFVWRVSTIVFSV
jgi:hypothetical protein